MEHGFAKRNHYNPCFWAALWNEQFFADFCGGKPRRDRAREQRIFTLNVRSNKIFPTKVHNVHYDKSLGVAEITAASMVAFCQRRFPEEVEKLKEYLAGHPDSLYLDFEQTLSDVERLQGYDALLRSAVRGGLESVAHKGFLACALVMHAMRSHELMTGILAGPSQSFIDKWEYFWELKHAWSNRLVLARAVTPLALGEWTFWRTPDHRFPLPDSPVMVDRDSVLAVLSPRLLLRIDLNKSQPEDHWNLVDNIASPAFEAFRRRAIRNLFNDLIAPTEDVLQPWQSLPEYQDRIRELATAEGRASCVREAAARIIWAINGFGRVPPDFESWAGRLFDRQDVHEQTATIRSTW